MVVLKKIKKTIGKCKNFFRTTIIVIKESTKLILYTLILTYTLRSGYLQKTIHFVNHQIQEKIINEKLFNISKEKYLRTDSNKIKLNSKSKLTDFIAPISIEIEKEDALKVQIPKISGILKGGIVFGLNKIKNFKNFKNKLDQNDQNEYNNNKLIEVILNECKLNPVNQNIVSLEDVLEEYRE